MNAVCLLHSVYKYNHLYVYNIHIWAWSQEESVRKVANSYDFIQQIWFANCTKMYEWDCKNSFVLATKTKCYSLQWDWCYIQEKWNTNL